MQCGKESGPSPLRHGHGEEIIQAWGKSSSQAVTGKTWTSGEDVRLNHIRNKEQLEG